MSCIQLNACGMIFSQPLTMQHYWTSMHYYVGVFYFWCIFDSFGKVIGTNQIFTQKSIEGTTLHK